MRLSPIDHAALLVAPLRHAGRRIITRPLFATVAVLSLSLSIGVTLAIYAALHNLFWEGEAVPHPERLVVLSRQLRGTEVWRGVATREEFQLLRQRLRSVTALAAAAALRSTFTDATTPVPFSVEAVTGNYFDVVGIPSYIGREIQDADNMLAAPPVVVLSRRFWESRLGAERSMVGRTVRIGGNAFLVIGVADTVAGARRVDLYGRPAFAAVDGWIPLVRRSLIDGDVASRTEPRDLTVITAPSDGSIDEALAIEVSSIGKRLDESEPIEVGTSGGRVPRSWTVTRVDRLGGRNAVTSAFGLGIIALVGLVLIVAATNVASLSVGRGISTISQVRLKAALGAGGRRLFCESAAEGAIVVVAAAVLAFAIASVLIPLLRLDIPLGNLNVLRLRPRLGPSTLAMFGMCVSLSLLVVAIVPAAQLLLFVRHSRPGQMVHGATSKWRRQLIGCQVAVSVLFVLLTVPLARAALSPLYRNPGFDIGHIAIGALDFQSAGISPALQAEVSSRLVAATHLPVGSRPADVFAVATSLPVGGGASLRHVVQVSQAGSGAKPVSAVATVAGPSIFHALGVDIVRGRPFDEHDDRSSGAVAVVSQHVARHIFGTVDVVGRRLVYGPASGPDARLLTVIGVAEDTDTLVFGGRRFGGIYLPILQEEGGIATIVLGRSTADVRGLPQRMQTFVRRADPHLLLQSVSPARVAMGGPEVLLPLVSAITAGLALLSATVAMLGLYGVTYQTVSLRTREIGLRIALGAEPRRVRRAIFAQGIRPVAWGVVLGLFMSLAVRRLVQAAVPMQPASIFDPIAVIVSGTIVLSVAACAIWRPAKSASEVDPAIALRQP